ncbi:MAG: S-methyl-5-thioribose-1-phosphate isomerase [Candidatus Nitrosothermus koennekii]|nr:MAG: S-methyl-5-thioribose-1-phosphate isomerase [Candidatus Nitrosothermus koennekii]
MSLELLTVQWKDNSVILIDQTKLPNKLEYVRCKTYQEVADAIKNMVVRGAPAIGVAAALGLALAAINSKSKTRDALLKDLELAYNTLRSTRPTAVNLFWALERAMNKAREARDIAGIKKSILDEALKMLNEDIEINQLLGFNGSSLIDDGDTVLTHCNAGALATVAYGTALGVLRAAKEHGKRINVIATETRPVMQGARLTAFELKHDGFDVSLAPDTAIGSLMARGMINKVIVGADRVLRTGHVYNKIGTYQLAILADKHNIPFYVAAPLSSFDLKSNPDEVIIEERKYDEVIKVGGKRLVPKGVRIFNPAFDLTPPELISAIITEKGVLRQPYERSIAKLFGL